jgi:single-stranded-DNA-specific exonuclease
MDTQTESTVKITARDFSPRAMATLMQQGMDPVLARIFAAREVVDTAQLELALAQLLPPQQLLGIDQASQLLADALLSNKKLLVVADYDCDGATACAVAVRGLRILAAACGIELKIDYLVPNRFEYGYGLTPEIVQLALQLPQGKPDVLITVDNGIASIDGVAAAKALGLSVLITDHHLPAEHLPAADAIVNPNQPGCSFPSKHLAGVGVMFYVLLALRAELRYRQAFLTEVQPRLDVLLDLVALGTVADVVKLDRNNRILVAHGLKRIRTGAMHPGIAALLQVAGRAANQIQAIDLGFVLGPRINAAGRLADMRIGIACLLSDDFVYANELAHQLDQINRERRVIESNMQSQALATLENLVVEDKKTLCAFHPEWHQGVIGILASRLRERFHRPTITFAPGGEGILKGSGRSIPGFHLRDALDLVYKRYPGVIQKFGGHAMAAGLTLTAEYLEQFTEAFEQVAHTLLDPSLLNRVCTTDGELPSAHLTTQFAAQLEQYVWGQGFPQPMFEGVFQVMQQNLLKDKHLRLTLAQSGKVIPAIWFNHNQLLPNSVHIAYRLLLNRYNGLDSVQMVIEQALPA